MFNINVSWHAVRRELFSIAIVVLCILGARSTLADHYHVPTGSMEDTLQVGDRVFVDKRAYGLRIPFTKWNLTEGDSVRRGEIVIFDSPENGKRLIKRIVALGGDDVVIVDGKLFVNGVAVADPDNPLLEHFDHRVAILNLDDGGGPDFRGRIKAGHLLAVGDHRGNSADGRLFGLIEEHEVYGRAIAVYYRRGRGLSWLAL